MKSLLAVCLFAAVMSSALAQNLIFAADNPTGVLENATMYTGCLELDSTIQEDVTVTVQAQDFFSVAEGVNFLNPNLMLTFGAAFPLRQCYNITILQDLVYSSQQQLMSVRISADPSNVVTIDTDTAPVQILEVDEVSVGFVDTMVMVPEDGVTAELCIEITSGQLAELTSVNLIISLADDTAEVAADYIPGPLTLDIDGPSSTACVGVTILDDPTTEATERILATLSALSERVNVVDGMATIDIIDNDALTFGISTTTFEITEGDRPLMTVQPVCAEIMDIGPITQSDRSVIGRFVTVSGTAQAGIDFVALNETVELTLAMPQACVLVTIIGDNVLEEDEQFTVVLSAETPDTVTPSARVATFTIEQDGDLNVCPVLPVIENGQVSTSGFDTGATTTYTCNEGYLLRGGAATRTCQASGEWSDNEPECAIICPIFTISEGAVDYTPADRAEGATATAVCNLGYAVSMGAESRVCVMDGTWYGQEPVCSLVDCGSLPAPANGEVDYASTLYQAMATYTCFADFRLENGNAVRTCSQTGNWTGSAPECNGALRTVGPAGLFILLLIAILSTML